MDPLVGLQLWQLPNNVCLSPSFQPYPHQISCKDIQGGHNTDTIIHFVSHFCIFGLSFPVGAEYNSDLSCHYKVELSYENLVTSGPDPHPPPIADEESDDEDDDDVPRVSGAFTSHPLIMASK